MNTQTFWGVIGNYNLQTWMMQAVLFVLIILGIILSYIGKVKWAAKLSLGIANLFIGVAFYVCYGTEPIQQYFALPLFMISGILFLYESYRNKEDKLEKPNFFQMFLLLLYLLYPVISILLGGKFPQMATYIMPCPIISLSIVVYAGYRKKNKLLLTLLTAWGLTGVKSMMFNAYEDLILLICGIYGIVLIINEFRQQKGNESVDVEEKTENE
ncbi:DUF6064 family protein [Lachnospiraceae bacterium HCP1S3_C3]